MYTIEEEADIDRENCPFEGYLLLFNSVDIPQECEI